MVRQNTDIGTGTTTNTPTDTDGNPGKGTKILAVALKLYQKNCNGICTGTLTYVLKMLKTLTESFRCFL